MQLDLVQLMLFATRSCFLILIWPWPRSMSPSVSGNQRNGRTKKVGSEEDKAKWEMSSSAVCCFSRAPMGKTQKSEGALSGSSEVESAALVLILQQAVRSWFGLGSILKKKKKKGCVPSLSLSHPRKLQLPTVGFWSLLITQLTSG